MALIVQKYGGSSLAGMKHLITVARRIARHCRRGDRLVIVVSAMGETTDQLYRQALTVNPAPPLRELDMLLTTGERQAMALLSLALFKQKQKACSFTGSQVGIITDRFHSDARIQEVRLHRITDALRERKVPIVAGFQGMSEEREITTLGRGGSDVTAVALAAALRADRCELYKDVDGIFAENPAQFPAAKPLRQITFGELTELAQAGANVIHPRACALAEKYRVPLIIRSSFNNKRGTMVTEKSPMEKAFVRAITHQPSVARLALIDVEKKERCLHQVVTSLSTARVPVLLFNHGIPHRGRFDLIFYIPGDQLTKATAILNPILKKINARNLQVDKNLSAVSLIGPGVGTDEDIICDAFATLHQAQIHLEAFALSALRLTCFIRARELKLAVTALLSRFRLARRKAPR
ncbi:MAG: aspartate kinase [bacterium]